MENKLVDRLISLVLIGLGIAVIINSAKLTQSAYGSSVGPNAFPSLLGMGLVLMSILLFANTFRYKNAMSKLKQLDFKKFLSFIALMVVYVLVLEILGYVISTFILLLVGFQLLEKGKLIYSIVIAAVFSLVVYFVYVELLKGTLPSFPEWLPLL